MQARNIPTIGPRYWTAMSAASVFGANMGDFVSHNLHLEHYRGLAPLALVFAAILWRERQAYRGAEAYYWLAVVVLRTAATNLADLATHDFAIGGLWVAAALSASLAVLVLTGREDRASGLPATDGRYWLALALAGTIGTALGDWLAEDGGLGLFYGSGFTTAVMAAALYGRSLPAFAAKPCYWLTVVTVRTAGTNVADLLASGEGFGLGLPVSTAGTGALLAGILLLWRDHRAAPDAAALPVSPR